MPRLCGCGCGTPLDGRRADAKYAGPSCRATAFKARQRGDTTPERFWLGVAGVRRRSRS